MDKEAKSFIKNVLGFIPLIIVLIALVYFVRIIETKFSVWQQNQYKQSSTVSSKVLVTKQGKKKCLIEK